MKKDDAWQRFKDAQTKLLRTGGLTMRGGGQALENSYHDTYRSLMQMGEVPKLRGKYRS